MLALEEVKLRFLGKVVYWDIKHTDAAFIFNLTGFVEKYIYE